MIEIEKQIVIINITKVEKVSDSERKVYPEISVVKLL